MGLINCHFCTLSLKKIENISIENSDKFSVLLLSLEKFNIQFIQLATYMKNKVENKTQEKTLFFPYKKKQLTSGLKNHENILITCILVPLRLPYQEGQVLPPLFYRHLELLQKFVL